MKSFAICILLASVCALFTQDLKAQIADQWLYNDTLVSPWIDLSWSVTNTMNSTEQVFDGSSSIKSVMGAYGGLRLHSGIWGSPVDVNPADYSHLEFSLYSATAGFALAAYVENSGDTVSPDFLLKNFPVNQWVNVAIPIGNIDSTNIRINRIVLRNCASLDNTIFIDNLRLVGKPDSTITPSAPTLLSPATSATNQLKRPVLSWLSSAGATSYHLQVSTSSSFSSTVFDDSTLFLTLKQITNLAVSTTYYWRVSAKNANGTSAYSSSFHFTTSAQNASDRWVYQDTLTPRWTTVPSWSNTSLTLQQNVNVYGGTYSVKAEENSWGGVIFRSGDWFPPIEVDPSDYEAAEVVIFNTTPGLSINVCIGNDDSGWTPGLTYWDLPINQWVILNVPMGQLNPSNFVIHDLIIRNYTGNDATYYIDDVRFVAPGATGVAPSTPVLVSPTQGIRTPSVTPTLSWKSSVGSTSYHVQVSSDSTDSSTVVDDSTLTTTVKTLPALSFNTNYYWRVKATNSSGTSSFSASRHFITQADTIPFPAILQDEFNAANGSLDGRMNWVDIQSQPNSGTMSIDSNAVIPSSSAGVNNFGGVVWDTLMGAGTEIRTILKQKSGGFSSTSLFLYARMDNKDYSTGTGYRLSYREQSGTDKLEIQKVTGGYDNATSLVTIYQELNIGDTLTFRVLSDNKTMIGRINGVNEIHVADETYLPSQWYYAVRGCVFTTPVRIDDFMASAQSSPLLSPPSLAAPSNGSTNQSAFSNLRWHPAAGTILDYSLQVSTDSNFSSLVFNDSTITDTSRMMTKLLLSSTYYWRVAARNSSGRGAYSTAWQFATIPDTIPTLVVAPLDSTVPTLMFTANRFLYSGANRVQFGVDTTKLNPFGCSTTRGKVLDIDSASLPGVKISILNHPEFGYTFSRSDGMYDMVVNGGGPVTVNFVKDGFLPAQRQLIPQWQDYGMVDDVFLIRLDTNVSMVQLGDSLRTAQGSSITDSRGTRQGNLIFQDSTSATMILADSSSQSLSSMHVRVTEYTIGTKGPHAMPAQLPPTSAYTYAIELSADEAVSTGARAVNFNKPVPYYVDNFIGVPVGQYIPVGYYDKEKGMWVSDQAGRVIKITSISGGSASIDIDGDNVADIQDSLATIGITTNEKIKLASLYSAGKTLWRVPVSHFSIFDFNWGWVSDVFAALPNLISPISNFIDNGPTTCSSIIDISNQTLAEQFSIVGTPYYLRYSSDRVAGYRVFDHLEIPLSNSSVPSINGIDLNIRVGGREFTQSYSPSSNLSQSFTWDGKDAFNRSMNGKQTVSVSIGYRYSSHYVYGTCNRAIGNCFGVWNPGNQMSVPAPDIIKTQYWQGDIGTWRRSPRDLGGMELTILHSYDPLRNTLYLGDGRKRSASTLDFVMSTYAGNGTSSFGGGGPVDNVQAISTPLGTPAGLAASPDGTIYVSTQQYIRRIAPNGIITTYAGANINCVSASLGDGGSALSANLGCVGGWLAMGPDSSLYFSDGYHSRIRKIDKHGIITTFAGTTSGFGFSGDNGPATLAKFNGPTGIAFGPDGSLYVADANNHRIRKISPDGIITTAVGNGNQFPIGDNGPATSACLSFPYGIAVGPDGSLYIADNAHNRIRLVDPSGVISTIAGAGGSFGDGGPATSATLNFPQDVTVSSDGTVYIMDTGNNRIRSVSPTGIINTVAGTGSTTFNGEAGPATTITINSPQKGIIVGPDGALYFSDANNARIRKVQHTLPGISVTDLTIPSEDASEIYIFNSTGKHLKTIDALTAIPKNTFNYDSQNRLASILDLDSLTTVFQRDTSGKITAIVSPFGQQTLLNTDSLGYITRIMDPAGDTTHLTLTNSGLLTALVDAKGSVHEFSYDSLGRLSRDENPAGGFKTFARRDTANGYYVTMGTAEERLSQYISEKLSTGAIRTTMIDNSGLKTITTEAINGTVTSTLPNGVTVSRSAGMDPRYGMKAPAIRSQTITLPSSLQATLSEGRVITNISGSVVTGFADSIIINGNTFKTSWDGNLRLISATTPEGRKYFARLDSLGRVIKDSIPGITPLSYTYDTIGRIAQTTHGARTNSFSYDTLNRIASISDPANRTMRYLYDSANRVVKQVLPDSSEINYAYDANGNITEIAPPGKPVHIFDYTSIDQMKEYRPPIASDTIRSTQYSYNLDGELTNILQPDSSQIQIEYGLEGCGCGSLVGLPKTITFDRGTLKYSYDTTNGEIKSITAPNGDTLNYTFDGPLLTKETWLGHVKGNVQNTYDNNFRVAKQKVNGTDSVLFAYDKDGLLKKAGSLAIGRSGQTGFITADTLGTVTSSRNYDSFGNLSQLAYAQGGSILFQLNYTRDSLSRVIQHDEIVLGVSKTISYEYDALGRLSVVKRNDTTLSRYFYDTNGNRDSAWSLTFGGISGSSDNQDRLITYNNASYTYTRNGELSRKVVGTDTTRYTFDDFGNITNVVLPNGDVIDYIIDGQSRRIGKKLNGQIIARWIYGDLLRPAAELDSSGNIIARYTYGNQSNAPEYIRMADTLYRMITDELGSTRLVINTMSNAIVQRLEYDEFGQIIADSNPEFSLFGFAGGLYDHDTKFTRFGAREYNSQIGKWVTKDPVRFKGGTNNFYEYAFNDPVNFKDSKGTGPLPGKAGLFESASWYTLTGWVGVGIVAYNIKAAGNAARKANWPDTPDGQFDAFRHCVWSCMNTKALGQTLATIIGNLHEIQGILDGVKCRATQMDLKNNSIGRECANKDGDCAGNCTEQMKPGGLTWY